MYKRSLVSSRYNYLSEHVANNTLVLSGRKLSISAMPMLFLMYSSEATIKQKNNDSTWPQMTYGLVTQCLHNAGSTVQMRMHFHAICNLLQENFVVRCSVLLKLTDFD